MFKLLFLLPLVALVDPMLLIWLWPRLPFWALIAGLIVLPLLVNAIARRKTNSADSPFAGMLRGGARIIAWYPGPLSKISSVLLLFPPLENALCRKAVSAVIGNAMSPEQRAMIEAAQTRRSAPASASAAPVERDENGLRRAQGRVIK